MKRRRVWLAYAITSLVALLALLGVGSLVPAVSQADVATSQSGVATIVPVPASQGGGVMNAVAAGGLYQCAVPQASIANEPGGYVIGNCSYGTQMYRSWLSDWVENSEGRYKYDGGYIFGDFQGCGWIRNDRTSLLGTRDRTNCLATASRGIDEFIYNKRWLLDQLLSYLSVLRGRTPVSELP